MHGGASGMSGALHILADYCLADCVRSLPLSGAPMLGLLSDSLTAGLHETHPIQGSADQLCEGRGCCGTLRQCLKQWRPFLQVSRVHCR